jgi:hypothetical protein
MEQLLGRELAGETEILGEILRYHFVHLADSLLLPSTNQFSDNTGGDVNIFRFGPRKGNVRNVYIHKIHHLHRVPSIIRIIKSRSLQWTGHFAKTVEVRDASRNFLPYLVGNIHLEDGEEGMKIKLRYILEKLVVRMVSK